jgi:hypothetical protein
MVVAMVSQLVVAMVFSKDKMSVFEMEFAMENSWAALTVA